MYERLTIRCVASCLDEKVRSDQISDAIGSCHVCCRRVVSCWVCVVQSVRRGVQLLL